jgi:hypothetical protein
MASTSAAQSTHSSAPFCKTQNPAEPVAPPLNAQKSGAEAYLSAEALDLLRMLETTF